MTERYLNLTHKPVVLVNQDGFYDDLLRFFDRMVAERFKSTGLADIFSVASSVEDIWVHVDNPRPFSADAIWHPLKQPSAAGNAG
jgi:predicted Rossmann-fold nucleotide-binding protein